MVEVYHRHLLGLFNERPQWRHSQGGKHLSISGGPLPIDRQFHAASTEECLPRRRATRQQRHDRDSDARQEVRTQMGFARPNQREDGEDPIKLSIW